MSGIIKFELDSLIDKLNLEPKLLTELKRRNYNTIDDLSKISKKELIELQIMELINPIEISKLKTIFHSNHILFDFEKEYYDKIKVETKENKVFVFKKLISNPRTYKILKYRFDVFQNIFILTEEQFRNITHCLLSKENIEEFIFLIKYVGLNFQNNLPDLSELSLKMYEPLISSHTCNRLQKLNINNIEELLNLNISDLCELNKEDPTSLIEIILFVEHLGYKFKEKIDSINDIYRYRQNKKQFPIASPISHYSSLLTFSAYRNLRKNDINIIHDLISMDIVDLFYLRGIGINKFYEIINLVDFLGYTFNFETVNSLEQNQIDAKRELVNQYNRLIKEQQELKQRELELKLEIENILTKINEMDNKNDKQKRL